MFKSIKRLFSPKQVPVAINKNWRNGMWVMYGEQIAIISKVGDPCEIHYVYLFTGETVGVDNIPLNALRQARWIEIPECRRNLTPAKGLELGYGA